MPSPLTLPAAFPTRVKAIASDLDRTLIGADYELHERTIAALTAARKAGIHTLIVTGRMFRSVRRYCEWAGIDDLVICYQGAVVADPVSGRFLRHVTIPLELAREAIGAVEQEGFTLNCYVGDNLYVSVITPEARQYADFQRIPIETVGNLLTWLEKPPTKLVVIGEPGALDGLGELLRAHFGERLYISKSLPFFLELASPEVSKGSGLGFAAERLGFTPAETIAFGDGENDVELLDWAGYSVAVANANAEVLEHADFVCPPVSEEGVAQTIEAMLAAAAGPHASARSSR
ncbi:MAG: Cof-type HAD-IIB family hydrolase [Gaiellaceae bacterium]|jgi:Cof subfamily protein (haloacid dehalogenase superfamily)